MLREQDALTVRVLTALEAESYGLPWTRPLSMDEFGEHLEAALAMEQTADDLLRHHGVTLSRGGACWPGFLRMWEPYRGPYGEPTTGRRVRRAREGAGGARLLRRARAAPQLHRRRLPRPRRVPRSRRGGGRAASRSPTAAGSSSTSSSSPSGRRGATPRSASGDDEHVVLLGQGRHVRRAHRRARAART